MLTFLLKSKTSGRCSERCDAAKCMEYVVSVVLIYFCSFSTKVTGHTGRQLEVRNGSFFSVLQPLCAFVILTSHFVTFIEIFKVNDSKFPYLEHREQIK